MVCKFGLTQHNDPVSALKALLNPDLFTRQKICSRGKSGLDARAEGINARFLTTSPC